MFPPTLDELQEMIWTLSHKISLLEKSDREEDREEYERLREVYREKAAQLEALLDEL